MNDDRNNPPGDAAAAAADDWATPPTAEEIEAHLPKSAAQQDADIAAANKKFEAKRAKYQQALADAQEQLPGNSPQPPRSESETAIGGEGGGDDEPDFIPSVADQRDYEAAMSRLPLATAAILDQRATKIRKGDGSVIRKWKSVEGVARDVCEQIGLQFLSSPDRDKNDDDLRKGGKFLTKEGGDWIEPDLTQIVKDVLCVTGTTTATSINNNTKTIKALLAERFHSGTLMDADAVIPPERLAGEDAIEPMVLDAAGNAISLARGKCGQPASQRDDHPLLRKLAVEFDADATCPEWDKLVHWAMQDRAGTRPDDIVRERVQFLEELLACGLYNGKHGNDFQEWAYLSGTGGNGKGACLDAVLDGIYGRFGRRLKAEPFFQGKYSGDEKVGALQTLEGAWLAVLGEAIKDQDWKESVMKDATGAPVLTVRPMGKPERDIVNSWFIIAQGNEMPGSSGNDAWTRRRHILIFDNHISKEKQNPRLRRLLLAEGPGIFNRLLAALERIYANEGLVAPDSVKAEQDAFERSEGSQMSRFVADHLPEKRDGVLDAKQVFEAFKNFKAEDEAQGGEQPVKRRQMTFKTFRAKLIKQIGANQVKQYQGGRGPWQVLGRDLINAPPPPPDPNAAPDLADFGNAADQPAASPAATASKGGQREQQRKTFNEAQDEEIPW